MAMPCCEAVIGGVVGKLVEYSVEPIKKQMKYLCCYSCNVQTLNDEFQQLNIKQMTEQERVDRALANNDVITEEVENWLKKVEDLKTRSENILDEVEIRRRNCLCKKLWLPELHYYYSLSRKALKTANECIQHKNIEFPSIANPVIPADIPDIPATSNYIPFESRVSFEDEIMKALKDPNVHSIGIWGLGGVGKTVMAKTIGKRVQDEKIFVRVVTVTVSQQPNILEMQRHIARELGLVFKGDSLDSQAKELHKRLTIEMSLLIIFDDIWKRLDLQEFGIPSHSKIILTSRNKDDLTSSCIPSAIIFELQILNKTESWNFFIDKLGINIVDDDDNQEFVQIAKKVERECKGLPLALMIVARALKDKPKFFWNNALRELQSHAPNNIPDVIKDVYECLQFSINALQGKEQKDLFFLCCLFPEDYLISTEELLRYGMGLGIFNKLRNLEDARDKVKSVLNILLYSSLLINGDEKLENFKVRMHDVVRDVGIWMMKTKGTEEHMFLIEHGLDGWPSDSLNNYTCISFSLSKNVIISFPESIVLPNLQLLRFVFRLFQKYDVKLPDNFFSGMGGLRVLEAFQIQLLPTSMSQLNNLRTLSLENCGIFETVSELGKLIKLEMLTFSRCDFEVLPKEIGNLTCLKQMNILDCGRLRKIVYGVLSKLVRLEELLILNSFDDWRDKVGGEDVACLSELNHLKSLTTLKIQIRNPSVVPIQKPLWVQRVKKYALIVAKNYVHDMRFFQKYMMVGEDVVLGDWICDMASDAEYVQFVGSNCMKFMKVLSKNCWNMRGLKILKLSELTDVQYLVQSLQDNAIFPIVESLYLLRSVSLQQVCEVSPPRGSFKALRNLDLIELSGLMCLWKFSINHQIDLGNLQNVNIKQCEKLSYLFSLSVAQSLVNLKYLTIEKCQTMKEIFKKEDGEKMEINMIKLPKLERISLSSLDSFYHFCNEINGIELLELGELYLIDLSRMKIAKGYNKEVDQEYLIPKDVPILGIYFNFCRLRHLIMKKIKNFKCMFSLSKISEFSNLEFLYIEDCSMLEKVIEKNDENVRRPIIFPNLIEMRLLNLPKIRNFSYNDIQFPSLLWLVIERCPLMLKFVEEVEDYISSSTAFLDERVECPKLSSLYLKSLNISEAFSSSFFFKSLTVLKDLEIRDCERLESVVTKEEEEKGGEISLQHLHLINLPKLRGSIFSMRKGLKFPLLEEVSIEDCPMLEKFSQVESIHFPNLKTIKGFINAEFATNFFYHKEMSSKEIGKDKKCFIISVKDISFYLDGDFYNPYDCPDDCHFVEPHESESFLDAMSFDMKNEIVGKFKIGEEKKIGEGIEYEVMLMMKILGKHEWRVPIEIELKQKLLPQGMKFQCTEILQNHEMDTWFDISIGKFVTKLQQEEDHELEFSMRLSEFDTVSKILFIKGLRFVQV